VIPQVWGALMDPAIGENMRCWAETSPNPIAHSWPCNQEAVSDLGLCEPHRREMFGL
jgi:hypothetical protein